jgi:voltage-gated potassium channel
MNNYRLSLFNILEKDNIRSWKNRLYEWMMFVVIIISIIPLAFKTQSKLFVWFDNIAVIIFIIDYIARWMTADYKLHKKKKWQSFLLYPFTAMAIIDLLSILPSINLLNPVFRMFRITRMMKILRLFKFFRYSSQVKLLFNVIYKERNVLLSVLFIAIFYIFITALIMFNVESNKNFDTFFDALYWATTTLTTVGYGDIYPMSDVGRFISMLSAIFGVAVIALPSGVITAGYLDELKEQKRKQKQKNNSTN